MENIKIPAKEKIVDYILQLNLKNIHQQLPKSGNSSVEMNYRLGVNEKSNKYAFVISEKISYYNGSMKDRRYKLYAFDINSGELIPNFENGGECYYGFFNDLKIVEDII